MASSTRKHRRELSYEVAKLRGLQRYIHPRLDDARAKVLARQICDQAEICLDLLDKYQASMPGRMWSYTERTCHPLRQDLKRTAMHFRGASGEWELRTGDTVWGRSWWNPTESDLLSDEIMDRSASTVQTLARPERLIGATPIGAIRPVGAVLSGLEFDPDPLLLPADAAQMMSFVTILVEPTPDGGEVLFGATLCTPEWIANQPKSASLMPGRGLLIVRSEHFDERRVRREIERFLAGIHEATWRDVATRITQWLPLGDIDGL